jgi:hypothetical protein
VCLSPIRLCLTPIVAGGFHHSAGCATRAQPHSVATLPYRTHVASDIHPTSCYGMGSPRYSMTCVDASEPSYKRQRSEVLTAADCSVTSDVATFRTRVITEDASTVSSCSAISEVDTICFGMVGTHCTNVLRSNKISS